jgi:hypothetical protein
VIDDIGHVLCIMACMLLQGIPNGPLPNTALPSPPYACLSAENPLGVVVEGEMQISAHHLNLTFVCRNTEVLRSPRSYYIRQMQESSTQGATQDPTDVDHHILTGCMPSYCKGTSHTVPIGIEGRFRSDSRTRTVAARCGRENHIVFFKQTAYSAYDR